MLRNVPGFSHEGWQAVGVDDLGHGMPSSDQYETCEACGHERICHVHIMEHADYPALVRVGRIYAVKMCECYNGRAPEAEAKSRSRQKPEWEKGKFRPTLANGCCKELGSN